MEGRKGGRIRSFSSFFVVVVKALREGRGGDGLASRWPSAARAARGRPPGGQSGHPWSEGFSREEGRAAADAAAAAAAAAALLLPSRLLAAPGEVGREEKKLPSPLLPPRLL